MADMYSYNGVKLAKVPVMHEGCKYGIIFYDEEDKCYYWFCSSEKFFLDGNQYMIPASATWGGNASREGAGYWSTAVFTPEESVETPDYYIVAHTGNIIWSSVDICQKDTETVVYRTTKPLQYPTISFTGNSKLYYVNAEPENLVCKATVNDGGTLSWAWYEGDVVVSTESLLTPPTDTVGEKTYFCVVTNDTEGQKLTTTSKTVTIRVREFFPLRECINWILPGLCSRPLPVSVREPVAYLYNGVRLPPIPNDTNLPCLLLTYDNFTGSGGTYNYFAWVSSAPWQKAIIGYQMTEAGYGYAYGYDAKTDSWGYASKWEDDKYPPIFTPTNPIWANRDVLNRDGSIYLAASASIPVYEDTPTAYLYNGVKLVALPEWDKAKYPYAFMWTEGEEYWLEVVPDKPFAHTDENGELRVSFVHGDWYSNHYMAEDKWNPHTPQDGTGEIRFSYLVWSNVDIYNQDNGSLAFAASTPVPVSE